MYPNSQNGHHQEGSLMSATDFRWWWHVSAGSSESYFFNSVRYLLNQSVAPLLQIPLHWAACGASLFLPCQLVCCKASPLGALEETWRRKGSSSWLLCVCPLPAAPAVCGSQQSMASQGGQSPGPWGRIPSVPPPLTECKWGSHGCLSVDSIPLAPERADSQWFLVAWNLSKLLLHPLGYSPALFSEVWISDLGAGPIPDLFLSQVICFILRGRVCPSYILWSYLYFSVSKPLFFQGSVIINKILFYTFPVEFTG